MCLTRSNLALYFLGRLGLLSGLGFGVRGSLTSTLGFSDRGAIEGFEVVAEGSGINLHNGGLGQGIGADQLVVTGMV